MFRFWPLNSNADVRATTCRFGILASADVISSVMPSEKNSWLASEDRLVKGSTATEIVPAGTEDAAASTPGRPVKVLTGIPNSKKRRLAVAAASAPPSIQPKKR